MSKRQFKVGDRVRIKHEWPASQGHRKNRDGQIGTITGIGSPVSAYRRIFPYSVLPDGETESTMVHSVRRLKPVSKRQPKVGDRVRVKHDWTPGWRVARVNEYRSDHTGETGTLVEVRVNGPYPYVVNLDNVPGIRPVHSVRRLKPVSKRQLKVGDRVRIERGWGVGIDHTGKTGTLVRVAGDGMPHTVRVDGTGRVVPTHSVRRLKKNPENVMKTPQPTGHQHWPGCHVEDVKT